MILDLSAGFRHVWHDKTMPDVIFLDRRLECKPSVVCDTRTLPFSHVDAELVVFDPPHTPIGATSHMAVAYGGSTKPEILDMLIRTGKDAARILSPGTLMSFKWNDRSWPLAAALVLMPDWEPLFGHGMGKQGRHRTETTWTILRRRDHDHRHFPLQPSHRLQEGQARRGD